VNLTPEDRLRQLVQQYCVQTSAIDALGELSAGKMAKHGALFKQLAAAPVPAFAGADPNLQPFEKLLDFYSLIEIGCQLRVLSWPLPKDVADGARAALGNDALARYYRETPGRTLPGQFYDRLIDERVVEIDEIDDAVVLFSRFLDLNATIEDDDDVEAFFQLLAAGRQDRSKWSMVESGMADPDKLFSAMEDPLLEKTLIGGRTYLGFCFDLDRLIQVIDGLAPEFSASVMQYHAPQLDPLGAPLEDFVRMAVGQLQRWPRRPASEVRRTYGEMALQWLDQHVLVSAEAEFQESAQDTFAMISRLTERAKQGARAGAMVSLPA
jgi:hypothetical protein